MPPKQYHSRPIVLRELTLLRALGASLRTSSYRAVRFGRSSLPLAMLAKPDPAAVAPASIAPLVPDKTP